MDRMSLTLLLLGFVLSFGCFVVLGYQTVQIAHIQKTTIELIVRTHRTPSN